VARRRKRQGLLARLLPRSPLRRVVLALAALAVASIVGINLAVAFFGETLVNPLSPFYLRLKVNALGRYFAHRPLCLLTGGHDDVAEVIREAARHHGVDRDLLAALVEVESGTRCHRISPVGAMGPAQLIQTTAVMLGVDDPFDPRQGIDAGARYLKEQLVRFHGNPALAVAAYNAGPGAVLDGRVPRNGETEFYVTRVLARWKELRPPPRPPTREERRAAAVALKRR
jgi:soluble lytic murein transglycosylase-like protein